MAIWMEERDPRARTRTVGCHHGNEDMMLPTDDGRLGVDRWSIYPSHVVDVPYDSELSALGWGRRSGRLPICPEHRSSFDEEVASE